MRKTIESSTVRTGDIELTVTALGEDPAAGPPSEANRNQLRLHLAVDGQHLEVLLEGQLASRIVSTVVAAAVVQETEADTARRYLRDFGASLSAHQVEELEALAAA